MRKYEQQSLPADDGEMDPVADLVLEASDAYAPTRADLAARLDVRPLALTEWRGGKRTPSPTTLRKMAKESVRQSDELRYLSRQLEAMADQQTKRIRKGRSKKKVGGGGGSESAAEKRVARIPALAVKVFANEEAAQEFLPAGNHDPERNACGWEGAHQSCTG
jgi:transcriptional regulator with XRE-family HTH domain